MSRYLNEINEFWQQYLEQYDAVYDEPYVKSNYRK
ncbi:Uncharacterised protein [Staphylococcus gallinarum]|uniref:Uncharacterized protein n=1 Tax=Staphylococcus gallinarum TaxID=1293 RepID=A0A380FHG6_STAGA|nr:Uncharacterised protein [Staphylococcus gallinarum]